PRLLHDRGRSQGVRADRRDHRPAPRRIGRGSRAGRPPGELAAVASARTVAVSNGGTVGRAGIIAADNAIRPYIRTTPVVTLGTSDLGRDGLGAPITLKLELLQQSGSFKVRGAF